MPAAEVIATYRDLWRVARSFRMSKSDLRARPMFHRTRDVSGGRPGRPHRELQPDRQARPNSVLLPQPRHLTPPCTTGLHPLITAGHSQPPPMPLLTAKSPNDLLGESRVLYEEDRLIGISCQG